MKRLKIRYLLVILCALLFARSNISLCAEENTSSGLPIPASPQEAESLQKITASDMNIPVEAEIMLGNNISMKFVLIPSGQFHMGAPDTESKRGADECPVHWVKISKPFYMGKYEVAQLQYNTVMDTRKNCKFKGDTFPVENINWYEVNAIFNRLCNRYGLKFRLPTEAEWEYACRAGTSTPFYTGETINDAQANYDCRDVYGKGINGVYIGVTTAVGSYPPNAFGLYDMHGNVWEWCDDRYGSNYYSRGDMIDPKGQSDEEKYVVRGGSWKDGPSELRSANRNAQGRGADKKYLGFRVVLEIPESGSIGFLSSIKNQDVNSIQMQTKSEKIESPNAPPKMFVPIEHELAYNEKTKRGYISVKGKGLEARPWMMKKIGEVCSSKNIVIQDGTQPEPGYFRVLDEKLKDGKYTIEFEAIR